jgi:hypothetical protein
MFVSWKRTDNDPENRRSGKFVHPPQMDELRKVGTNMASHVFRTKDGIYFPRLLQGFMKGEVEQLVLSIL